MAAAHEAFKGVHHFGGKNLLDVKSDEGALAARVHHLGQGAVGEKDATAGVEGSDAIGDGFEHGLELGPAGFEGGVDAIELEGGLVDLSP